MTGQLPRRYGGIDTVDANPDEAVTHPLPAYAARLCDELVARLEGEVRFDNGSHAAYSTDSSNYRPVRIADVPIVVRAAVNLARSITRTRPELRG